VAAATAGMVDVATAEAMVVEATRMDLKGRLEPQMASARNPWRHAEPASGPVRGVVLAI
jgi:hypothetical protein